MLQEKQVVIRRLVPDRAGNWLYKEESDGSRVFSQLVYLGSEASASDWQEYTEQEKAEWEAAHTEAGEPTERAE